MKEQRTDFRNPARPDGLEARDALAEVPPPAHRKRRLATAAVVALSILVGAAMSVVPVPDRESTREVRPPGRVNAPKEPMAVTEQGYGFPFRTYIRTEGPRDATPVTYAHLEIRLSSAILNILIATLLGVIALGSLRRRKRSHG